LLEQRVTLFGGESRPWWQTNLQRVLVLTRIQITTGLIFTKLFPNHFPTQPYMGTIWAICKALQSPGTAYSQGRIVETRPPGGIPILGFRMLQVLQVGFRFQLFKIFISEIM
jgi:hypothetical protein